MKEERNEIVSIWVTPTFKKELEAVKDNAKLRDSIIKNFFEREKSWLEEEIKDMDDSILRYRAKLLTIQDNLGEHHQSHVDVIEKIFDEASKQFKSVEKVIENLEGKAERLFNKLNQINDKLPYLYADKLEKLLDLTDRYNEMSTDEKQLIKMIIERKD